MGKPGKAQLEKKNQICMLAKKKKLHAKQIRV